MFNKLDFFSGLLGGILGVGISCLVEIIQTGHITHIVLTIAAPIVVALAFGHMQYIFVGKRA